MTKNKAILLGTLMSLTYPTTLLLNEETTSPLNLLEQQVLSEEVSKTRENYEEIANDYVYKRKKVPAPIIKEIKDKSGKVIKRKIYFCAGYAQLFFEINFGRDWCIEKGLILPDGKPSGGTWNIVENVKDKGYEFWRKENPEISVLKQQYRKANHKQKLEIINQLKLLSDKWIINQLMPLDVVSAWYKDSHYNDKYFTHLAVYLNHGKILQQWGDKSEIISINELYSDKTPAGIERVLRFDKPTKHYFTRQDDR
jgi:hypothetical protein